MFVRETYRTKPRWAWKAFGIIVLAPLVALAIMLIDHHQKAVEKAKHPDPMMVVPRIGSGG